MKTLRESLDEYYANLSEVGNKILEEEERLKEQGAIFMPNVIVQGWHFCRTVNRWLPTRGSKRKAILEQMGLRDAGDVPVEEFLKEVKPSRSDPELMLDCLRRAKQIVAPFASTEKLIKERRRRVGSKSQIRPDPVLVERGVFCKE